MKRKKGTAPIKNSAQQYAEPTITITVPCYNEEKTLGKTLDSLIHLNYPKDKLSIIVVNDGSTDNTLSIATVYANKHINIQVIDKPNGGKASAMNLSFQKSTSELFGSLDADSFIYQKDALKFMIDHFMKDDNLSAVTPAIIIHKPKTIVQLMQHGEYSAGVFIKKAFSIIDSMIVTPGPLSIFRRSAILSIVDDPQQPWQHAHGTEDFEMGLRLQKARKRIANVPAAIVHTTAPDTLYHLYLQRVRWAYGFIMNLVDYKYMLMNPKYGNVGMLVLPMVIIGIFGTVSIFIMIMKNAMVSLWNAYDYIQVAGINHSVPKLDLFYINTNTLTFIFIATVIILFITVMISEKLSNIKMSKKNVLLSIMLYGFVAPFWVTSATIRAIFGKESKWRVIR